ncbi:FBX28-like protein [Mya arenaria]|uniref:FBX28-like protein n=1 Tax=Mya arenaria TaxID=6604 RepID=A0ABY7FDI6_MYAAR|nr:FBX28-like protein [Mya arenaria]
MASEESIHFLELPEEIHEHIFSYLTFHETSETRRVLDELLSILFRLQCKEQPPRSHEFLQELRDISSMAMEHFDEKIAPNLKNKLPAITLPYPFSETCASTSAIFPFPPSPVRGPSMRSEVTSLGLQVRGQTSSVMQVRKEVVELKNCYTQYKKKIVEQEKKLVHQGQTIIELDKKVNDLNQKFVDLAAEFQKLREQKEGGEGLGGSVCHVSEKGGEEVNGFLAPAPGTSSKTTATKRRKRKSGGKAETAGKRSRRSNN